MNQTQKTSRTATGIVMRPSEEARARRGELELRLEGAEQLVSAALGNVNPPSPIHWDHIVWGYIKMGRIGQAQTLAQRIAGEQPRNGPIWEALGYTAVLRKQFSEAAQDFQRAIEIRPNSHVAHYNLAKVYLELGDREHAAAQAKIALSLDESPDYRALAERIQTSQ